MDLLEETVEFVNSEFKDWIPGTFGPKYDDFPHMDNSRYCPSCADTTIHFPARMLPDMTPERLYFWFMDTDVVFDYEDGKAVFVKAKKFETVTDGKVYVWKVSAATLDGLNWAMIWHRAAWLPKGFKNHTDTTEYEKQLTRLETAMAETTRTGSFGTAEEHKAARLEEKRAAWAAYLAYTGFNYGNPDSIELD